MKEAELIIEDIVQSVPEYCKDNQLKTFTYIYCKVATLLEYDSFASELIEMHLGGYDRERAEDLFILPASSIECLTSGRALCSGYAVVLKEILTRLGISTEIIISKGIHEWNQVSIDGKWYNCDLTNDRDFITEGLKCSHFLTSNADDCNFQLRPPTSEFNECNETIDEETQEQLINEAKDYIEAKEKETEKTIEEEQTTNKSKFGFVEKIKKRLQSIKGGIRR